MRLDSPGLEVTDQRVEADHAVLVCRIAGEDRWVSTLRMPGRGA